MNARSGLRPMSQSRQVLYALPAEFGPLANLRASEAKRSGSHYLPPTSEHEKDLI